MSDTHAESGTLTTKPDYGLDAPGLVKGLLIAGLITFVASWVIHIPDSLYVMQVPLIMLRWFGVMALLQAGLLYLSSYYGKIRGRDHLVAMIPWRGDEQVLDVGCGRGLLTVAAARKLTTGTVTGIDVWRSEQLSENWAEAAWDNVRLEGVEDRVEIRDADYRELPFPDASFDVIIASLAFYSLSNAGQRLAATRELARVLKPGGRLAILDAGLLSGIASGLNEHGLTGIERTFFRPWMYPPSRILTARKPLGASPGPEPSPPASLE